MLDEIHGDKLPAVDGDSNSYTFGRIGKQNVVVASLPSEEYGAKSAACIASHMSRSVPCLCVGLLVGIGGGFLKLTGHNMADLRLGGVVVSDPTSHTGGVIQYDLGKTSEGEQRPERTEILNKPSISIRTAVARLKANHDIEAFPLKDRFDQMIHQRPYLISKYMHKGRTTTYSMKLDTSISPEATVAPTALRVEATSDIRVRRATLIFVTG